MNLVEFKQAVDLQHHMIPKNFTFPIDTNSGPLFQSEYLRAPDCPLLIKSGKCTHCQSKEIRLRSQHNVKRKLATEPVKSNAPLSMTSPERLQATVQEQRQINKLLGQQNAELSEKLKTALEKDSVTVDDEIGQDFVDIFKGEKNELSVLYVLCKVSPYFFSTLHEKIERVRKDRPFR